MTSSQRDNHHDAILIVDLTRRLPDVDRADQVPPDLERFGRFAILRSGAFWYGPVESSHPSSTEDGFYWGLRENRLYVSPRGSTYAWTSHITPEIVRTLAERIGLRRRFRHFRVEK